MKTKVTFIQLRTEMAFDEDQDINLALIGKPTRSGYCRVLTDLLYTSRIKADVFNERHHHFLMGKIVGNTLYLTNGHSDAVTREFAIVAEATIDKGVEVLMTMALIDVIETMLGQSGIPQIERQISRHAAYDAMADWANAA